MKTNSFGLQLLFWLVLGAFSTFFAEVTCGSDPMPFFHTWGLLVVFPLYTLHTLALAYLVFTYGRPHWTALFAAGILFGLYEAYITKVIWSPFWGPPLFEIGGIAVIETLVLTLFWHPLLSFYLPLCAAEITLTGSRIVAGYLPRRLRERLADPRVRSRRVVLTMALLGVLSGANAASPETALLSGLATTSTLLVLTLVWRAIAGATPPSIEMLLPNRRQFTVLAALLLLMYGSLGVMLNLEALPGFVPQALVWGCYAAAIALLRTSLKHSRTLPPSVTLPLPRPSLWRLLKLATGYTAISTAVALITTEALHVIVGLTLWGIATVTGLTLLVQSIRYLRRFGMNLPHTATPHEIRE
ncbi:MAG: hypothetical protein JXB35_04880 [Anaerolineae bacterium]|nr:hypothetical protein [Anaerolineae bacterium]